MESNESDNMGSIGQKNNNHYFGSESNGVGDSFISPYNSPDKKSFEYPTDAAGDASTLESKINKEQQATPPISSFNTDGDSIKIANGVNDEQTVVRDILNSEIIQDFCTNGKEEIQNPDAIEKLEPAKDLEIIVLDELSHGAIKDKHTEEDKVVEDTLAADKISKSETDVVTDSGKENCFQNDNSSDVNESHCVIAEMIASVANEPSNDQLSPSEMFSVSKKMEAEYRSMVISEQHRKKRLVQGKSYEDGKKKASGISKKKLDEKSPLLNETTPKRLPNSPSVTRYSKGTITPVKSPSKNSRLTPSSRIMSPTSRSRQSTDSLSSTSSLTKLRSPMLTNVKSRIGSFDNAKHTPTGGNIKIESRRVDYTNVSSKIDSKKNINHVAKGGAVKIESKKLDLSNVSSKCGSMANTKHTPGGGKVKIQNRPLDFSNVSSKCGSKYNMNWTPPGGDVKIFSTKVDYSKVGSRIQSTTNVNHTPGGGKVTITNEKIDTSRIQSKIGSKENMKHSPRGGKVKIFHEKVDLANVKSKVGSKDNVTHTPTGGKVKIFNEKINTTKVQSKIGSKVNITHTPGGGKVKIFSEKIDTTKVQAKIGSKDNITHSPRGGNVKIQSKKLDFSNVKSKCGSLDNTSYVAGGGDVQIFSEKPAFKETAKSKIGSLDYVDYIPGGGDVKIFDENLPFEKNSHSMGSGV